MINYPLDSSCSCENTSHSRFGSVEDKERLVRVLTNKHYKADYSLLPTAFSLKDIEDTGVSLVRVDKICLVKFQEIAESIRCAAKAEKVEGALTAKASCLRAEKCANNARTLCVIDDPVSGNEAHCIIVSSQKIDRMEAKAIRHKLLEIFSEARYLSDMKKNQS